MIIWFIKILFSSGIKVFSINTIKTVSQGTIKIPFTIHTTLSP